MNISLELQMIMTLFRLAGSEIQIPDFFWIRSEIEIPEDWNFGPSRICLYSVMPDSGARAFRRLYSGANYISGWPSLPNFGRFRTCDFSLWVLRGWAGLILWRFVQKRDAFQRTQLRDYSGRQIMSESIKLTSGGRFRSIRSRTHWPGRIPVLPVACSLQGFLGTESFPEPDCWLFTTEFLGGTDFPRFPDIR